MPTSDPHRKSRRSGALNGHLAIALVLLLASTGAGDAPRAVAADAQQAAEAVVAPVKRVRPPRVSPGPKPAKGPKAGKAPAAVKAASLRCGRGQTLVRKSGRCEKRAGGAAVGAAKATPKR